MIKALAILAGAILVGAVAQSQGPGPAATPSGAAKIYADNCAGCHGADMSGGRGPSLVSDRLLSSRSDAELRGTIATGVAGTEMPAFKGLLTEDQIGQVIAYLRLHPKSAVAPPPFVADPDGQIIHSDKQDFRVEVVARDLMTPWGMAFLPDGRMLVTERPGRLRIIGRNGALLPDPVAGLPAIHAGQDAGLLDVALHPDYRRNGWIYLSYTDVAPDAGQQPVRSMTVLIRGKLDAHDRWVRTQEIFRAPEAVYTASGSHYGSRFLFDRHGHVFFSLGERGDMTNAQNLGSPLGKIHRVDDDGSIPQDNPFVRTPGAIPSIWSYGHRNPEGLAWDPVTGQLWEAEHGPMGGDEINVIEKGRNYGWGVISMGKQAGITRQSAPGMEQPITFYTPAIAPSGIGFYRGNRYPGWKNDLFVTGLAGHQLRRLEIRDRTVVAQEILFDRFGRTRDVATGPDGLLYVLLQSPTGAGTGIWLSESTPGLLVRLVPIERGRR